MRIMSTATCFKHEALGFTQRSLRLVDLLAKQDDGAIRCTISHTVGHPNLRYTAVSYEWGPHDSQRHTIYINGRPFEMRHNLLLFLSSISSLCPRKVQILTDRSISNRPKEHCGEKPPSHGVGNHIRESVQTTLAQSFNVALHRSESFKHYVRTLSRLITSLRFLKFEVPVSKEPSTQY